VILVHDRQYGFVDQFSGTRILDEFPWSRHTIDPHEASGSAYGLLLVARTLATDIIQAFGFPEVPQITEVGEIRWPYIGSNGQNRVKSWAERQGVGIVATNLEQEP
jgi:hypothetical protein